MPITAPQKHEIDDVINVLFNASSARGKRRLADMFLELVDRQSWPEYYEVIPEPRCLDGIKATLEKNKYKDPLNVYNDLNLVFLNALYYNEESSQISKDARTLKAMLDNEWKQRSILPTPRESPPPSSAQKTHKSATAAASAPAPVATAAPLAKTQPAQHASIAVAAPAAAPQAVQVTVAPKSPERQQTPDMDVDVGGTPEPEGVAIDTARDGESEEIVSQLEKGLPRWEGFGDVGWAEGLDPERQLDIVRAISKHVDANGTRLAASLDALPEESSIPELSFNFPLSLSLIENRTLMKYYKSSKDFDKEMSQLFLKARRWFEPGSEAYGNILVLQRLYHALASSSPPSGPPYASTTNFASLRAGPGTAKPMHTTEPEGVHGVTTYRVSTKDRTFVDEVQFKGWSIHLADWLHMSNPDDPSKPIVGQVFRCFTSDEPARKGQPGVTVCWYYRPEQTWHPANRQFWEKEVFKTSHFADHPLEDIIEKIACQFTARHIRGRPRPPFWYPGWPLYVCDSRYNDRERIFVKIKNWNSCVPEEVRKSTEFMPIYPFERTVFPRRFASPFVSGKNVKGPGGIGDVIERVEGEKIEGGGTGRKRPRRAAAATTAGSSRTEHTDRVGPSKGLYVGASTGAPAAQVPYQYAQTTQYPRPHDRTVVTAAGGLANLGGNISTERLPPETAKQFDRDPQTNEVLWFASPPVDMAHTPAPQHSLKYLHFMTKMRKNAKRPHDAVEGDGNEQTATAPKRKKPRSTVSEALQSMMTKFRVDLSTPPQH
ncbi:hypothetical protein SCP_0114360 [Sparassis crispa]|uniref:Chromatin structure-remodeling complex subunit rsc1 n=1 Tax=Sparassis crispa TaxID=139825 RepID=A0A401G8R3_9APHY|nr:hypothetical protein SCP_0114360 [Sparassis crispa]GBE78547.1 hypothetical protein SCP_0114360 [Sparassis crispa]